MTNPAKRIPIKHKEPNGKTTHIFGSEKTKKTNRKSGCTLCANVPKIYPKRLNGIPQMVKWDTPNGKMGYPKWRNGTSQKAKWDTPKGKMGYPKW